MLPIPIKLNIDIIAVALCIFVAGLDRTAYSKVLR